MREAVALPRKWSGLGSKGGGGENNKWGKKKKGSVWGEKDWSSMGWWGEKTGIDSPRETRRQHRGLAVREKKGGGGDNWAEGCVEGKTRWGQEKNANVHSSKEGWCTQKAKLKNGHRKGATHARKHRTKGAVLEKSNGGVSQGKKRKEKWEKGYVSQSASSRLKKTPQFSKIQGKRRKSAKESGGREGKVKGFFEAVGGMQCKTMGGGRSPQTN